MHRSGGNDSEGSDGSESPVHHIRRPRLVDVALIVLLVAPLLFFRLGSAPLANPDEGRYAEVPREMLASGDFVLPRLDGVLFLDKPPLLYWLIAGVYAIAGPSELAARLVPALSGLAGCIAAYLLACGPWGRRPALAGALVLGTSILWLAISRIVLTDMLASASISTALFAFLAGMYEPPGGRRRAFFSLVYLAAGLATLAKGLIGFLLPGAVVVLFLLARKAWSRLRPFYLPSGVAIFLLVALPWHVLAALRHPRFASYYFVHEHFQRYFTASHGRVQPFWFFLPVLLIGLFPWAGFLPSAFRRVRSDTAWFFVIWATFVLLFFSASGSKLIPYVLPAMPPLAMLIGRVLAEVWDANPATPPWGLNAASIMAGILGAGGLLLAGYFLPARHLDLRMPIIVCATSFVALAFAVSVVASRRGSRGAIVALWLGQSALLLVASAFTERAQGPSAKPFAGILKAEAGGDLVLCYADLRRDLIFYTGRFIGTVEFSSELRFGLEAEDHTGLFFDDERFRKRWKQPARVWLIGEERRLDALLRDPGFPHRERARSGPLVLVTNDPP